MTKIYGIATFGVASNVSADIERQSPHNVGVLIWLSFNCCEKRDFLLLSIYVYIYTHVYWYTTDWESVSEKLLFPFVPHKIAMKMRQTFYENGTKIHGNSAVVSCPK